MPSNHHISDGHDPTEEGAAEAATKADVAAHNQDGKQAASDAADSAPKTEAAQPMSDAADKNKKVEDSSPPAKGRRTFTLDSDDD